MTTTEAFAALMPEPAHVVHTRDEAGEIKLYSTAQMRAMFDAATERAAKLCENEGGYASWANNDGAVLATQRCAAAIRAREDGVANV